EVGTRDPARLHVLLHCIRLCSFFSPVTTIAVFSNSDPCLPTHAEIAHEKRWRILTIGVLGAAVAGEAWWIRTVPITLNKYYNSVMVRVSMSPPLRSSILNTQYSNAVHDTLWTLRQTPPFHIPCILIPTLHPSASTRRIRKAKPLNPP